MPRRVSHRVVAGVDVGGPNKGFHAVALRNGRFLGKLATRSAAEVAAWCGTLRVSAVGVDAPCSWSRTGQARPCERALARERIHTFATPSLAVGEQHRFYRWMCNGAELYRALARRYRLFDGHRATTRPCCFETFPHAVACALAGTILPAKHKRRDRPQLLRKAGIRIDSLTTPDEFDAALCALTAEHLVAGHVKTYGEAAEGFILVPDSSSKIPRL